MVDTYIGSNIVEVYRRSVAETGQLNARGAGIVHEGGEQRKHVQAAASKRERQVRRPKFITSCKLLPFRSRKSKNKMMTPCPDEHKVIGCILEKPVIYASESFAGLGRTSTG